MLSHGGMLEAKVAAKQSGHHGILAKVYKQPKSEIRGVILTASAASASTVSLQHKSMYKPSPTPTPTATIAIKSKFVE